MQDDDLYIKMEVKVVEDKTNDLIVGNHLTCRLWNISSILIINMAEITLTIKVDEHGTKDNRNSLNITDLTIADDLTVTDDLLKRMQREWTITKMMKVLTDSIPSNKADLRKLVTKF